MFFMPDDLVTPAYISLKCIRLRKVLALLQVGLPPMLRMLRQLHFDACVKTSRMLAPQRRMEVERRQLPVDFALH